MVKQKLPPLEVLIGLCRAYTVPQVAEKYGVSRQAVHLVFKNAGVQVPDVVPLADRLMDALMYVLNAHQTPGDPYYSYARKMLPDVLPEVRAFKFREDEVS